MTFVSYIKVQGRPVFHADTLVTRTRIFDESSLLAQRFPGVAPLEIDSEHKPAFLCQKISKIDECSVLAWTGSVDQAGELIKQLKRVNKNGRSKYSQYTGILKEFVESEADIGFVFVRYSESDSFEYIHETVETSLGQWGQAHLLGSGGSQFYGLLSHLESESPDSMSYADGQESAEDDLYLRPLHMLATLQNYSHGGISLEHASGAFFQCIDFQFNSAKCKKNILFLNIWTNSDELSQIQHVVYTGYRNDNLIITEINLIEDYCTKHNIPTADRYRDYHVENVGFEYSINLNRIDRVIICV